MDEQQKISNDPVLDDFIITFTPRDAAFLKTDARVWAKAYLSEFSVSVPYYVEPDEKVTLAPVEQGDVFLFSPHVQTSHILLDENAIRGLAISHISHNYSSYLLLNISGVQEKLYDSHQISEPHQRYVSRNEEGFVSQHLLNAFVVRGLVCYLIPEVEPLGY